MSAKIEQRLHDPNDQPNPRTKPDDRADLLPCRVHYQLLNRFIRQRAQAAHQDRAKVEALAQLGHVLVYYAGLRRATAQNRFGD